MKRVLLTCACFGCALLGLLAVAACGSQQKGLSAQSVSSSSIVSSTASSSVSSSSASSSSSKVVQQIGAGNVTVRASNGTGYDVTGIRIKPTSAEDYSSEDSFDGFMFANGSTADLSFAGIAEGQNCDVLLLTSVDSKIAVRDINLTGLNNITFWFEEGIGYITFTDPTSGKEASNRDQAFAYEDAASQTTNTYDAQNQAG